MARVAIYILVFSIGMIAGVAVRSAWYTRDLTQHETRDLVSTFQEAYRLYATRSGTKPEFEPDRFDDYARLLSQRLGLSVAFDDWPGQAPRFRGSHFLLMRGGPAGLMVFTQGSEKICLVALKSRLPRGANRLTVNGEIPVEVRSGMGYSLALIGPATKADKKLLFGAVTDAGEPGQATN